MISLILTFVQAIENSKRHERKHMTFLCLACAVLLGFMMYDASSISAMIMVFTLTIVPCFVFAMRSHANKLNDVSSAKDLFVCKTERKPGEALLFYLKRLPWYQALDLAIVVIIGCTAVFAAAFMQPSGPSYVRIFLYTGFLFWCVFEAFGLKLAFQNEEKST